MLFEVHNLDDALAHECRGLVKRFRAGLVLRAHRLLYHSTLGSRVIRNKNKNLDDALAHKGPVHPQHLKVPALMVEG